VITHSIKIIATANGGETATIDLDVLINVCGSGIETVTAADFDDMAFTHVIASTDLKPLNSEDISSKFTTDDLDCPVLYFGIVDISTEDPWHDDNTNLTLEDFKNNTLYFTGGNDDSTGSVLNFYPNTTWVNFTSQVYGATCGDQYAYKEIVVDVSCDDNISQVITANDEAQDIFKVGRTDAIVNDTTSLSSILITAD
jgi:hypothetical protein